MSCTIEILIYLKLSCLSQYDFHESAPLFSPFNHMYSPPCVPLSASTKRGRDPELQNRGIHILRIKNDELQNMNQVLKKILVFIDTVP